MPPVSAKALTFYPPFCWSASPTYNAWVKLSAANVHALRRRPGYESYPRVWFLGNHPIRFVRLVGVVTSFTEASEWTELTGPEKRRVTHHLPHTFTVDDGSGCSLEVVLWRNDFGDDDPNNNDGNIARSGKPEPYHAFHPPESQLIPLGALVLKKTVGCSVSGDMVDLEGIKLGATVKVKGWVGEFRGEKQLLLERVSLIADMAEEIAEWEALATFQADILAKPWTLPKATVVALRDKADKSAAKASNRDRNRHQQQQRQKYQQARAEQKAHVDLMDPSQEKEKGNAKGKVTGKGKSKEENQEQE